MKDSPWTLRHFEYCVVQQSVGHEEMLTKQTESLQQETTELQSCISELEEENLALREHLQELTGAHLQSVFSSRDFPLNELQKNINAVE